MPEPIREKLECDEDDEIVGLAENWNRALASAYPGRQTNPLVIDVNGRSVLMTRYLRALAPPNEVNQATEETSGKISIYYWPVNVH